MNMKQLEPGSRLVVASHNPGKIWEIKELIAPYGFDAVSAADLDLSEPEETEETFEGNARLKAFAAANASGLHALADDSGLEVDLLGGARKALVPGGRLEGTKGIEWWKHGSNFV